VHNSGAVATPTDSKGGKFHEKKRIDSKELGVVLWGGKWGESVAEGVQSMRDCSQKKEVNAVREESKLGERIVEKRIPSYRKRDREAHTRKKDHSMRVRGQNFLLMKKHPP